MKTAISKGAPYYLINNLFLLLLSTAYMSPGAKALNTSAFDKGNTKQVTPIVKTDSVKADTNQQKEKVLTAEFKLLFPFSKVVWSTALSNAGDPAYINQHYGKISSIGFGVGVDANLKKVYKGVHLFFDLLQYNFKEELVQKGDTGDAGFVGYYNPIRFPLGAKYKTQTTAFRLGLKYVYTKNKTMQPWIGAGYSYNVWTIKYVTWDEDKYYGKATGSSTNPSIMAGINFKVKDVATFTIFYEGFAPFANYRMANLFGTADFDTYGGGAELFPNNRIGISIGGL